MHLQCNIQYSMKTNIHEQHSTCMLCTSFVFFRPVNVNSIHNFIIYFKHDIWWKYVSISLIMGTRPCTYLQSFTKCIFWDGRTLISEGSFMAWPLLKHETKKTVAWLLEFTRDLMEYEFFPFLFAYFHTAEVCYASN